MYLITMSILSHDPLSCSAHPAPYLPFDGKNCRKTFPCRMSLWKAPYSPFWLLLCVRHWNSLR